MMCTKKIKAIITSDHKLDIKLPVDIKPGEVEVIILQDGIHENGRKQNVKDYLSHIHKGLCLGGSIASSRDELHDRIVT